jgi:DNA-binding NarL/FixJ family response regulator
MNKAEREKKIRVAIADDHAVVRSGLKLLINSQPDLEAVGEAGTSAEVLSLVAQARPDVLLLDISMPQGSGLNVVSRVRASFPATDVVVLTMHNHPAYLRSALAAGASGFVLKQAADVELLSAIRAASKGGVFVDPILAGGLLGRELLTPVAGKAGQTILSDREQQVLKLLAQGYSNQEIAKRIFLSVKTVETYRLRLSEKLMLRSRSELTRYALATGLLDTLSEDEPVA